MKLSDLYPTHSSRYTNRVRKLRVALPVAAVLMLAVVFIWPHFDPAQAPKRHAEMAPPEMNSSIFTGVDKRNRPFTITADKAVQKASNRDDIDLVHPLAELLQANGSSIQIQADQGEYRQEPGLITLEGDVHLFHDQGYEFITSSAALDLQNGIAWGDQPIAGHGPRGEISGEGFRMIQDSDKIIFTGNSRLLLRPEEDAVTPETDTPAAGEAPAGEPVQQEPAQ